jgi:hypothetical protein
VIGVVLPPETHDAVLGRCAWGRPRGLIAGVALTWRTEGERRLL